MELQCFYIGRQEILTFRLKYIIPIFLQVEQQLVIQMAWRDNFGPWFHTLGTSDIDDLDFYIVQILHLLPYIFFLFTLGYIYFHYVARLMVFL